MSPILPILCRATILAALAAGSWSGLGLAQNPKAPELQIEAGRAQHELTVAENVLRDARAAREKVEAAVAQRLARLEEQRRNAAEQSDPARRQAALRAINADQVRARAELADALVAEAAAEKNVETAALALARARTAASESSRPNKAGPPTGGTAINPSSKRAPEGEPAKPAPTTKSAPAPSKSAPAAKAASAPAKSTPAAIAAPTPSPPSAPAVSPEDLVNARIEVEAAEAAHERAKVARADIERKTGDEIRDLAKRLADAAELRKRSVEGPKADEAASLEARLKTLIQEETAKARGAESREAEALARLETARAREARVRAEIEARLPAR